MSSKADTPVDTSHQAAGFATKKGNGGAQRTMKSGHTHVGTIITCGDVR